jgi:transposase IS116/IS110/IS902 family protein
VSSFRFHVASIFDDTIFAEIVAADTILAQRYELLTSMRGVGPTLAFTLIALLPELGQMSRKQIAALVGLAPYDFDSGKPSRHLDRCWTDARYFAVYKVFRNATRSLFC